MRSRPGRDALLLLGSALATAGLLGAAWTVDSRRRAHHFSLLHRVLVDLLLNAISAGDPVTERHSRRVADLTDVLADRYGFRGERRARLRVAALLHDMGKIDDRFFQIVHSCEPLTAEQRRAIEQHPQESADILRPLEHIHPGISPIVESHHECWDGQGYPQGLKGEQIPLEGRLISAADVFDAMTQPRSYHEPLAVGEALEKIRGSEGVRFDPTVVQRLGEPQVRARWERIAREGQRAERRELARAKSA